VEVPQLVRLVTKYVSQRKNSGDFNARTAVSVRGRLMTFAADVKVPAEQVNHRHVEKWMAQPGLSPAYRYARLSALRGFCDWCVQQGHMRKNPCLGVRTPRIPEYAPRFLTDDEMARVVHACPDTRTLTVVLLMAQEALRCGEVARMQVGDVDLTRSSIGVRGKGGRGELTRYVPLSDQTRRTLRSYFNEDGIVAGPLIRSIRFHERGLTPSHIGNIVTDVLWSSGVKVSAHDGKSPHSLRHTACQHMVDAGADLRKVQAIMGHKHLSTTETYLRGEVRGLRDALEGREYG
jgi:site-specific recombinase XerD